MKLRMIKSAEEIAHITQGAAVCDIGGFAVTAAIREGVPEHEETESSNAHESPLPLLLLPGEVPD